MLNLLLYKIKLLLFKTILGTLLFYGTIFAIIFIIAYYFYAKAVASRKFYKCPVCGESFRVEQMSATNCKVCGAPIKLSENNDVSDKTF